MTKESLRIVIVEDDPNDAALLRHYLMKDSEHAYKFTTAESGVKGVRACLESGGRRPDCAIVGLHLPDMSGLDVLNRLKDETGEVVLPVVLFIDSGDECKQATAALRAGAQDYISKSWLTADGLACAVEHAIERGKLRARLKAKRESLEQRDREFRALVENAPDIIARFDADRRHLYVNPAIGRATGLSPESFLGKTASEAGLPPESAELWESALRDSTADGRTSTFEFDLRSPSGPRRYQARIVPQLDETGAVESVLAVSTDVTRLKRAEDALRSSEEHVRNVIDRIVAFVGVTTPEGVLVEANKPALESASLKPQDVLGLPLEDTYWCSHSPEVRAIVRDAVARAAGGETVRRDVEIRIGEGRFATLDLMIAPLLDPEGKPSHLIASGVDITGRKRTERAMREIAAREAARSAELRAVLRAAPAAIWIAKDPECRRIVGNPASYRILGVPERTNVSATADDETQPRAFAEYADGEPVAPEDLPMQRAARGVEVQGAELTIRREDGTERHIYGNAMPLQAPGGAVYGSISAFIDITKLKQAEEALKLGEKRFRRFAVSNIIGIVLGRLGGGHTFVNDEFLRVVGYTREEFEEARLLWSDLTPPRWREVDEAGMAEARRTGSCAPYEKEYIRRDGSLVPVLVGYTLLDEAGDEVVAFILDLTERKRSERELRESDRRKGEFLAMLAHELRNPLAAIRTAVHVLLLKGPNHPELKWGNEVIERQAKHLTRLIEDLLDVSRISSGEIRLKPAAVDLRDVASWAADTVWPLVTAKQHSLEIDLPPAPLMTTADPARLQQVLSNLLTNAAKYTDNGGSIKLTGSAEGSEVVLRIRDDGIGISAELLPHIFALHTQAESNAARSLGGLGIGLSLVRMIVEAHGGSVSAASDGLGRGSEFTVRLPALEAEAAEPGAVAKDAPSTIGLPKPGPWRPRVLVVDENVGMAQGLAMLVESSGYEVKTAHDRASALALAREFRPRFALLDVDSEAADGDRLARDLREDDALRGIRLVALSKSPSEKDHAADGDFHRRMPKPVDLKRLLLVLEGRDEADGSRSTTERPAPV